MKQTFDGLVDHMMEAGIFVQEAVELLEKSMIARALERTNGNRSAASKLLGIHRNTMQKKMAEFKLDGASPQRKPPQKVKAATGRARRA
jgi:DNA-binding NtrC family response regulator